MTLARFVIVNQKGGDCKGILPLTIILVNNDTDAIVWTNIIYKYIHRFSPHMRMQGGKKGFSVGTQGCEVKRDPPIVVLN